MNAFGLWVEQIEYFSCSVLLVDWQTPSDECIDQFLGNISTHCRVFHHKTVFVFLEWPEIVVVRQLIPAIVSCLTLSDLWGVGLHAR